MSNYNPGDTNIPVFPKPPKPLPKERHGQAVWPGIVGLASCSFTMSHGISPGVGRISCQPQPVFPAETGDLVITDNYGTVIIRDCKITDLQVVLEESFVWQISLVDHRWKWQELGQISGCYNQLDKHAKLIPWTIRSPTELAILCLQAMGVPKWKIDLPYGLGSEDGKQTNSMTPPWLSGVGTIPTTGTNPPVNWEQTSPARALQSLCDSYGKRIVYQWSDGSVIIGQPGVGKQLPPGSIAKQTPSIKSPNTPSGVTVAGAPTRYQGRWLLEPVGEDWDGSIRPIDYLSYAPVTPGILHQVKIIPYGTARNGTFYRIWLNGNANAPRTNAQTEMKVGADGITNANIVSDLMAKVQANATLNAMMTAATAVENGDQVLVLTAKQQGVRFAADAECQDNMNESDAQRAGGANWMTVFSVRQGTSAKVDWSLSIPPTFANVRATERLTFYEAQRLAQKSVWKYYRLFLNSNFTWPLFVPGYGTVIGRQWMILEPTQVEQVVPVPGDNTLAQNVSGAGALPVFTVNFYNGYSKDKPAAVYGPVFAYGTGNRALWIGGNTTDPNTPASRQVHRDFQVVPEEQMIVFSDYTYKMDGNRIIDPFLVLQTAVQVRNGETNHLECFSMSRSLLGTKAKGLTNYAVRKYPDVQALVVGHYATDGTEQFLGFTLLDADSIERATYYLDGLEAQYFTSTGETREYNGIVPIELDGAISQVTWNVGDGGAYTTMSRNTEHSVVVPRYATRRQREFMAAAEQTKISNAVSRPRQGAALVGGGRGAQGNGPGGAAGAAEAALWS